MKNISHIAFGLLLLFISCNKEKAFDCVKSTGTIQKETRYFSNFSSVYVEDNLNVILVQNLPEGIILEAGENVLPKIKCEQNGNVLKIKNKNTCNWVRSYDKPYNVYIGVNQVKEISQKGYGKITNGETISTDTLRIYNLSFGETDVTIKANFIGFIADDHSSFKIAGKSNSIAGGCYKNASTDTRGMKTRLCYMINYSLLDAIVFSDSTLQAEIGGNGNIVCYGHPADVQMKLHTGSGNLILP